MTRTVRNLYFAAVAVFLASPIVVVLGVSLNAKKRLFFPPDGVSLRWYADMLTDAAWRGPIENSLIIATVAGLVATSIALPLAYVLWRHRLLYAKILYGLGIAPFMLPPVITAVGFMVFWAALGHYGQFENVVIAHGIFLVTLPLMTISLGLEALDREMLEAARTMGADEKTTFLTVVLPLVRPYIISGYAFTFVLSMNEYIIAYMVAGFTVETLPIKIFNALRYGYSPVMAAVAVMFVMIAILVFGLIGRFGNLPRLLGRWEPMDR
ncbi:Inner membrane ABC transporter permease protein YdcV [wastewater metagenome]|uniref:Inner membrane ABC transporter permease protein YdcV n=3 Tax=root TaxID=1 RepID=A0A5B8RJE9_9ZZZZ|nr:ABC transporter permease [Arhodomonas aquaeolei]MCS4503348.1 ABC transporter permease [Arhodomonas aquaeolei]QEA06967.1 inner membrane ABC transporter permease protein YdcV [uncultured organism]